jgi:hypothetical protein
LKSLPTSARLDGVLSFLRLRDFSLHSSLLWRSTLMRWRLLRLRLASIAVALAFGASTVSGGVKISIDTPMPPPGWAVLERELLDANARACRKFFEKYFDERGWLLCVERWGGDDGPDDAIENCNDWPILHALGAGDDVLTLVNTNQVDERTVEIQAGGYAAHQFIALQVGRQTTPVDDSHVAVRLAPGAGERIFLKMRRYANRPTMLPPWDRQD